MHDSGLMKNLMFWQHVKFDDIFLQKASLMFIDNDYMLNILIIISWILEIDKYIR